MSKTNISSAVYRLLSGIVTCKIGIDIFYIYPPSIDTLCRSVEIYKEVLYTESFQDGGPSINQLKNLIGSPDIDKQIAVLADRQDDIKIDMYDAYGNSKTLNTLRQTIRMVRSKLDVLYEVKHRYDHLTPEGIASSVRSQFLLVETIHNSKHEKLFSCSFDNADYIFLNRIMDAYVDAQLSHDTIRSVARSDTWRSYWNINKLEVFGRPPIELTDEQRALVGYSRLYDSIYESADCPPNDIIEDDDMLDGWLIKRRKERERDANEKALESKLAKHSNDTEVFLPASSKEDIKKIEELNTTTAKMQKKQRDRIIQQRGQVSELEFPDVQIDILNKQSEGR